MKGIGNHSKADSDIKEVAGQSSKSKPPIVRGRTADRDHNFKHKRAFRSGAQDARKAAEAASNGR